VNASHKDRTSTYRKDSGEGKESARVVRKSSRTENSRAAQETKERAPGSVRDSFKNGTDTSAENGSGAQKEGLERMTGVCLSRGVNKNVSISFFSKD